MAHDIIDNQEEKLTDHVGRMLSNAERAKFAVGYFFLSGFRAIADRLAELEELRLLIGSTTNLETLDELVRGQKALDPAKTELERQSLITSEQERTVVRTDAEALEKSAAEIDQTDENELYLKSLAGMIESGKIKVRVYTKGTLHAKAYIVDYPEGRYERGSAIVGSSNLSLAGISSNTELNVVVPGNENHEKLSVWFEARWSEAVDFDENLMQVLRSSWAMSEPTPYELYLKVVYELVKDRLAEPEEPVRKKRKGFPTLYSYQSDAVKQARSILKQYDGVFLADVVGLGKTYMGAGLLTDLYEREGWRALVVCPPLLMKLWREVIDDFDLNARVVSIGKLAEVLEDERLMRRELVLVDESHRFRNENTQRYKDLAEICFGKKVVMLTATPQNTGIRDVYNQLKLFHPHEWTNIPVDPANLREYFKEVEAGRQSLPELLEHILIRRTRRHILRFYGADMREHNLQFPKRMPPVRIDYSIDDVYPGIYDDTEKHLLKLRYARYDLWHYARPEYRTDPEIAQLKSAGKNLVKLMRATFFKRLESSVAAFRLTLTLLEQTHESMIKLLEKGAVPAGPVGEEMVDALRAGDEDLETELLQQLGRQYPAVKFDLNRLIRDIQSDLRILTDLAESVKPIKPENDAKLQRLISELHKDEWEGQKTLIFTQYAATAAYIGEQLAGHFDKVEHVSGGSKDLLEVVRRFAPKANQVRVAAAKEIRILVATDVLSEGLNLQDCNRVISYDIHWNPVKLIQRIGRVDRVSTGHEEIWTYNFFPERKLEQHLGLEARVRARIADIHRNIGEDARYLSSEEQLSENAFFKIYSGDESVLDEGEDDSGFADLVQMIQNIKNDDPELFERVLSLPHKIRSAKSAPERGGLIVFCKAGQFYRLYRAETHGKVTSQDQNAILKELQCDPKERRRQLPRDFNAKVSQVAAEFEAEANQRENERLTGESDPLVRSMLRDLKSAARGSDDKMKRRVSRLRQAVLNATLSKRQRTEYRRLSRKVTDKHEVVDGLESILSSQQTSLFEAVRPLPGRRVKAQIIASEALTNRNGV